MVWVKFTGEMWKLFLLSKGQVIMVPKRIWRIQYNRILNVKLCMSKMWKESISDKYRILFYIDNNKWSKEALERISIDIDANRQQYNNITTNEYINK